MLHDVIVIYVCPGLMDIIFLQKYNWTGAVNSSEPYAFWILFHHFWGKPPWTEMAAPLVNIAVHAWVVKEGYFVASFVDLAAGIAKIGQRQSTFLFTVFSLGTFNENIKAF